MTFQTLRQRIGARRWNARFERHNGNQDDTGNPTYSLDADWVKLGGYWPCEVLATTGGETIRGRQTAAESTHILYGEFFGAESITPADRCVINGQTYGIVAVDDADGLQMERRIELKLGQ